MLWDMENYNTETITTNPTGFYFFSLIWNALPTLGNLVFFALFSTRSWLSCELICTACIFDKHLCNPLPDFLLNMRVLFVLVFFHGTLGKISPCTVNRTQCHLRQFPGSGPERFAYYKPQCQIRSMLSHACGRCCISCVFILFESHRNRRAIILISRPSNSPRVPEQSVFSIKEPVPHNSVWFYANDPQRLGRWKLLFSRTS